MLSRLILFCCLICASLTASAQVVRELAVLEDKAGTETIETVVAGDPARFKPLAGTTFAGGYTRSVHWFRVTLEVTADEAWLEVLPPILDDVRLYEPDPAQPGLFRERRQGDTLSMSAREIDYRGFVFKMLVAPGTHTVYLRLQSSSSSMMLLRVSSPDHFPANTALEYGALFASIAIVLTVLLLNVNAWFWLRDPLTPWFIVYLLLLAILFAGNAGLLQQYIFLRSETANNSVVGFAAILLIAFGNAFYARLLQVERSQRLLYGLYTLAFWGPLLGLLPTLLGYFTETMRVLTATVLPITLVSCGLSVRQWRRGAPGGAMMLVANLFSLAGIASFVLFLRGHVAGGAWMLHSLQLSSLGSILALQLAVGARYRSLRDEGIQAERDARNEREQRIRQGQFLAMLAHELRTSLSVLQMAFGSQPMKPKAIDSAKRAMTGMGDVIERSIQAEKLAEGSLELDRQPCDVVALLEAVIADSPAAERFVLDAASRPSLYTDGKLLRVILANLVDNAAKYGAPATPIEVTVSAEEGFTLSMRNAIGPAGAPDPSKVFEKYYRAPHAHGSIGSGLGLHIAQAVAQLLGGTLQCQVSDHQVSLTLRLAITRRFEPDVSRDISRDFSL